MPLLRDYRTLLKGISLSEDSDGGIGSVSAFDFDLRGIGWVRSGTPVLLFCASIQTCDGPPEGVYLGNAVHFAGLGDSLSLSL